MRSSWALLLPLSLSLSVGCDALTPSSLPGPLPVVEATATRYARLASIVSPGTRVALSLRGHLLSRMLPYQAALHPTADPGSDDPVQRYWDTLQPELRDPGLVRAGLPLRFPEIGIGAPDPTQPLPNDALDAGEDPGQDEVSWGDPALVGAYQADQALLILDASGGFSLGPAGKPRSLRGAYQRQGRQVILRSGSLRRVLLITPNDALRSGDGLTYRPLTGDAP